MGRTISEIWGTIAITNLNMNDECECLQVAFANLKFTFSPPLRLKVNCHGRPCYLEGVGTNKNMLGFVDVYVLLSDKT